MYRVFKKKVINILDMNRRRKKNTKTRLFIIRIENILIFLNFRFKQDLSAFYLFRIFNL